MGSYFVAQAFLAGIKCMHDCGCDMTIGRNTCFLPLPGDENLNFSRCTFLQHRTTHTNTSSCENEAGVCWGRKWAGIRIFSTKRNSP